MNNILDFEITENDIKEIFEKHKIYESNERSDFLKGLDNYLEVQAVPGSGKTKILGVKIGLLLKKWKFANSGICVLTHTNVAKAEILKSCKEIDNNCKMEHFPHFIGTIQEFVDKFLAIPYLKSHNFIINQILDKYFERANLNDIVNSMAKVFNGKFFYEYTEDEKENLYNVILKAFYIQSNKIISCCNKEYKEKTIFQKLEELKQRNAEYGYFLYRDMYAFANALIEKNEYVLKYIRNRFKICFVDEAQDTNKIQGELIKKIFKEDTNILQILGDVNQKIYDFDKNNEYSFLKYNTTDRDLISMNTTYRFNNHIKKVVNMFSANESEIKDCKSNQESKNIKPYLILYNNPEDVLEKFVNLLKDNNLNNLNKTIAIVGAVNNKEDESKITIKSYIQYFEKQNKKTEFKTANIIKALNFAKKNIKGDFCDNYKIIFDTLYNNYNSNNRDNTKTKSDFKNILKKYNTNQKIFEIMKNSENITRNFIELNLFENEKFKKYFDLDKIFEDDKIKKENNILIKNNNSTRILNYNYEYDFGENEIKFYDNNQLKFKIKVDTIHGVKGETHDVTLLLETFHYMEDIAYFLKNPGKKSYRDLKKTTIYVGVSRPRELLCLASKKDNYSDEEIEKFKENFEII